MKLSIVILAILVAAVAAPAASAQDQPAQTSTGVYGVQQLHQSHSGVSLPLRIRIVTDRPNVRFALAKQGVSGQTGLVGPLKPFRVQRIGENRWATYLVICKALRSGTNYNITAQGALPFEDYPQGVVYAFHVGATRHAGKSGPCAHN